MIQFELRQKDPGSKARSGVLQTAHYDIDTPNFMPVATQGSVKATSPAELTELDVQIIVANTYHLMLRPGSELIREKGGLHKFMNWDRAILTDSGGFQAYSLSQLIKTKDEGIEFSSHLDGSKHFLSPELAIKIQDDLGSDIAMVLDFFTPYPAKFLDARLAVERTVKWARQSLAVKKKNNIFGIIQGATYKDLRRECTNRIVDLKFTGYGIGGLMIGEPSLLTNEMVEICTEAIPDNDIRYLMGCGYPEDIIESVERGVDLFDCVLPTRNGRTGMAFTSQGKVIVGKPKERLPAMSGALRMTTWSSKTCFISLEPESNTRSFNPISVSLSLSATRSSTLSAFTARGKPVSLARFPISSTLSAVAA